MKSDRLRVFLEFSLLILILLILHMLIFELEFLPWKLQNKWENCMNIIRNFKFRVSHIYREENVCADRNY